MRLPRDLSADELVSALKALGYQVTRQTGSHLRLTTHQQDGHHLTIPQHNPLRVGTLHSILTDVASHFDMTRDELMERLFGEKA